jgi:hypothetical protein
MLAFQITMPVLLIELEKIAVETEFQFLNLFLLQFILLQLDYFAQLLIYHFFYSYFIIYLSFELSTRALYICLVLMTVTNLIFCCPFQIISFDNF